MANFTDEHKEEMGNNKYFEEGVHKVKIMLVVFGTTDKDQEYAEFTVTDGTGELDGQARVWFTTDKAMKYSFNIVKGIFTHNAPEDQKDKVREKLDKIKNTEELEKACQMLIGKECWFSVYQNKERPYTKQDGSTSYSFDRNITGYEPKPRSVSANNTAAPQNNTKPLAGPNGEDIFAF